MDLKSGLNIIPVSAIIPTCNRQKALKSTLHSISEQNFQPKEILIIDASDNNDTKTLAFSIIEGLASEIKWHKAEKIGAATQRNIGIDIANCPFILFLDDDIIMEKDCIEMLWRAIQSDDKIGGVCPIVINQQYKTPGKASMMMYRFMSGIKLKSYAGKCIGPAWNLWTEDNPTIDYVQVDWMSTVCALYRLNALPKPLFPEIFKGYSIMEDVYLSLTVAKSWHLINVTKAKIFHDSQPGEHKKSIFNLSKTQMINRHFIMKNVMEKHSFKDYIKLLILETFLTVACIKDLKKFFPTLMGKFAGIIELIKS